MNLGEAGALGPDVAVLADDGGGGQVVALHLAHQVLVDVLLPRHLRSLEREREGGGRRWWLWLKSSRFSTRNGKGTGGSL